ncbi:unnamed protein product [Umbelopsis vinacea]
MREIFEGFIVIYDTGLDNIPSFDAYVKTFGDNAVKIVFDNPYINGRPIKVTVGEDDCYGVYKGTVLRPAYKQPYILKLEPLFVLLCMYCHTIT